MSIWLTADIGGTKVSAAAFDGQRLIGRTQTQTRPGRGANAVTEEVCLMLRQAAQVAGDDRILGIGIACPGPLSPSRGVVIKAPMLGWENYPLKEEIEQRMGCPALIENDANAAAYGEYKRGAGRGAQSVAYITISTGVGCGLVLGGKILEGFHESAGELGHLVIHQGGRECACGRRGCLETYASGTAIGRAADAIQKGMNACDAAACARAGDERFIRLFADAGEALGFGIAAIKQLIDVECVVLGGSVTQSFDLFAPALTRTVQESCYFGREPEKWLKTAALNADCGLIGAGILAMERFTE